MHSLRAPLGTLHTFIAVRDFRGDSDGRNCTAWNASLASPLWKSVTGLVKLAEYNSRGFARDATNFWMQIEWAR